MGDDVINDADLKVLVERMNANLDWQKRMDGKMDTIVQLQLTLASQQEQIRSLESGQKRLFEKSDEVEERIAPLRDEMIGNRKLGRMVAALSLVVPGVLSFIGLQWHPWTEYTDQKLALSKEVRDQQIGKWQYDVGQELRRDDNRLTVLEFRANNIDSKAAK